MDSEESSRDENVIEVLVDVQSVGSTPDPPMEEWSSLMVIAPEANLKKIAFSEGLYDPGIPEICAKYVAMSDSSIFRHPYYAYPAIPDPGIEIALLEPEKKIIYPDDGQELYLALCKEMNQCPIRKFHKYLIEPTINLSYYGVNPQGVRAMSMALYTNRLVKVLDLTDNFLNDDACFHLGHMLTHNSTLEKLILAGCRVGSSGASRIFAGLIFNRHLQVLNLNRNQLGDTGGILFAEAAANGLDLKEIHLSNNNMGTKTAAALSDAFEYYNKFILIDLSWNNFFSPLGLTNLLNRLEENKVLESLNLAWNSLAGPRIATSISNVLKAPNLHHLDLSSNQLQGEAITQIISSLGKAKKLVTLNLSNNPMDTKDSFEVLSKLKFNTVKVQNIYLDNVLVSGQFVDLLERIKHKKNRMNTVVTYGDIVSRFQGKGKDPRELVLDRAEFLAKKPKKNKADIALIILQLLKENYKIMEVKEFQGMMAVRGANLDDDLAEEISNVFAGPKFRKAKTIDLNLMGEYVKRKWPDRHLPLTPPPEPEPEPEPQPEPEPKKGKKKGKGK